MIEQKKYNIQNLKDNKKNFLDKRRRRIKKDDEIVFISDLSRRCWPSRLSTTASVSSHIVLEWTSDRTSN